MKDRTLHLQVVKMLGLLHVMYCSYSLILFDCSGKPYLSVVTNELDFCNISSYCRYICDKLQSFAVTQLISSFALL